MTATDLDVSLTVEQEVDILRSDSICLNGKKLALMTGNLPNDPVHLKLDESREKVEFRAGRFKSKLAGTDSEQFHEVPRAGGRRRIRDVYQVRSGNFRNVSSLSLSIHHLGGFRTKLRRFVEIYE